MAEGEETRILEENAELTRNEFPTGRVKRIMRLDEDVKRVSAEALFLVSRSTDLFLQFLADRSARVAIEKKRKTVKLEHVRIAVKRHQPTSDFLLDSLPPPSQPENPRPTAAVDRSKADKPAPPGTRRIDQFFRKHEAETGAEAEAEAGADAEGGAEAETGAGAAAEAPAAVAVDE